MHKILTFNLPKKQPQIIETYTSGTEWYHIYSDGWIEQGGLVSNIGTGKQITFIKEFIDTNYSFLVSELSGSGGGVHSVGGEFVGSTKRTTSSTWVYVSNNNTEEACFWRASGYTSTNIGKTIIKY